MNDPAIHASRPQADALNAICPYWTMFPLSFPLAVLAEAKKGEWVLDPFCGRGTTLYAARKLGLPAVGIDSNAVATAIAAAKLVAVKPDAIVRLAEHLLKTGEEPTVPEGEFWQWCFAPAVLHALCCMREGLADRHDNVAVALRAILLGALHGPRNKGAPSYFSNQMPRTYSTKPAAALSFWRAHDLHPHETDVLAIIGRHADRRYSIAPRRMDGSVHNGDARAVLSRLRQRFDWVITSPPYPGMVTYRPDGWLRGWMVGGPAEPDYNRNGQLGSLTGARFVMGLAEIWKAVAKRCKPHACLAVRFGALPSARHGEPEDLLMASFQASGRWRVLSIKDAGTPARVGARQANQAMKVGKHVPEVDVLAVRES